MNQSFRTKLNSKSFLTEDFLLQSNAAKNLYHSYAKDLPIIDYHNHLPPQEIAENKKYNNITELWLKGDHYKWRAMRTLGVNEKLITGNANDEEKFLAWAKVVPSTVRNPLFHWTLLELKNSFNINSYLTEANAAEVYSACNELLLQDDFRAQPLLKKYKVFFASTTDDPCDDLAWHKSITAQNIGIAVHPAFRPDKIFQIDNRNFFTAYLNKLSRASAVTIIDMDSLLHALQQRVDYFHENNCRISDHGLNQMPSSPRFSAALEAEFKKFLANENAVFSDPDAFAGYVLLQLSKMYYAKGWVQQFHLGPLRNTNSRLLKTLGADCGVDSIGDLPQANALAYFLNELDKEDSLTKTIIYNNNPADNEVFAGMAGNFNDGTIKGKIQFGTGWWFLDQKDGMEKQMNALSNVGIISAFIGMTTDSRSFLSYSRHEYFRRILCNLFGDEMERGLLPNDEKWMGGIVQDICYYNARDYFNVS
ncbi:MAG: glucuronate isomerase [Ginsengibacter sp.]